MNEEFEKFINDISKDQDASNPLEQLLGEEGKKGEDEQKGNEEEVPEKAENENEPRKNRQHRRWETRLTDKEKDLIAREARLNAREEMNAERTLKDAGDIDPRLIQLYGTEERGKEAAALTMQVVRDMADKAREEALQEFEKRQAAKDQEVKQFETFIDSEFENLEDEHGLDLTSKAPAARKARNEILTLLEKLSPKDTEGNIREYADINGVYDTWKQAKEGDKSSEKADRTKDISSRSMVKGGDAPAKPKQPTPGFFGWRDDFGL